MSSEAPTTTSGSARLTAPAARGIGSRARIRRRRRLNARYRKIGEGSPPMSVAPETGRNRIMIYGPKPDGTYVVELTI